MQQSLQLVGVGASAGGLKALIEFFEQVPGDCNTAFLVIQHLSPLRESMMAELLRPHAKLTVVAAVDGMQLQGGAIYLCPPGVIPRVQQLKLSFELRPQDGSLVLPIDHLFESIGRTLGAAGAAVLLSGTGSDGSRGIQFIEQAGGVVAVQSPASADFSGMPQSAISTGKCRVIAPANQLWRALEQYLAAGVTTDLGAASTDAAALSASEAADYAPIFNYLEQRFSLDFSLYRISSVARRLTRRMGLLMLPDAQAYLSYLEQNDNEGQSLYQDLLLGVTEFFRDAESFEQLGREAIRPAMRAGWHEDFRIWSAGCATGQEAYSLYMLADEVKRELGFCGRITVFASDVFQPSIDFAGRGVYSTQELSGLSVERLDRYFETGGGGAHRIQSNVRDNIVFTRHNFLTDVPFINMDVVSCRNVLIYLNPEAQAAALKAFTFSLRDAGFLFLGASESLGQLEPSFQVVSNEARIFQKHGDASGMRHWPGGLLVRKPEMHQMPQAQGAYPVRPVAGAVNAAVADAARRSLADTLATMPPAEQVKLLQAELQASRQTLEAVNQELQLANEELQVSNEELQSTNEELCSLNEELTTLNTEYERKNQELVQVNASHENLLASIEDGVLDVDMGLRIRRFNTAIKSAFSLKSIDVGRPLRDIAYKMEDSDSLLDEVRSVLETGERIEGETALKDGRCYMKRIMPCLDEGGKIHGVLLTFTDVTEVRRLEKRFGFALETAELSWWDWDLQQDVLRVTSGGSCLLGEGCLSVARKRDDWMELVHPADQEQVRRTLDDCLQGRTAEWDCEHRFRTDTGGWLWVQNQGQITRRDDNEAPLEMMGTTRNVDSYKQAVIEAQNGQAILATAEQIAKVGAWEYDPETREIFWSDEIYRLLEVEKGGTLFPENTFELMHPEDRPRLEKAFERTIQEGIAYDLQLRFRTVQGCELLCRAAGRARYDEQGNIIRVVGIFQDITELTTLQRELEAFFNLSPDFQATLTMEGNFKFWSPSWEKVLGYAGQELASMSVCDLVAASDREDFCRMLREVAAGKSVTSYETQVVAGHDAQTSCGLTQPWMSWSFSCEPKLGIIFVSARCVTAQKQAQQALQEARAKAEEANRAKSDFLAVMSHELRTPLNPILGFADMLLQEVDSAEQREILQTIVESGNHMLSLIEEILGFSKLEAGKTEVEPVEFSLTELVDAKVHLMSGQLRDAPIQLSSSIDWGSVDQSREPVLIGDVGMIRQVCRNLIANAIKFTRAGQVDFDVAIEQVEEDRALVRFSVKDTGIGIAPEDLSKLFVPFSQVQSGSTREFGGTGLGLAICQRLVNLMDGRISVESQAGEGSTFSFTLPLKLLYLNAKSRRPQKHSNVKGVLTVPQLEGHILLVEDNASNALYIERLIDRCGAAVKTVCDGESALEQLQQGDFDVILLDLHMPGIGGLETLKRIRALEHDRAEKVPVFILTADASEQAKADCLRWGANGFLIKPIAPGAISDVLAQCLR